MTNEAKKVYEASVPSDEIEKAAHLNLCKSTGKSLVELGEWEMAASLYWKASNIASNDGERAICLSNLSLVFGKMEHWHLALDAAIQATELDHNYSKGFYRLGRAEAELGMYSNAIDHYSKALSSPEYEKELQKKLSSINTTIRQLANLPILKSGLVTAGLPEADAEVHVNFFLEVLTSPVCESGIDGSSPYIEFASDKTVNRVGAKRLVFRPCYAHLLPVVVHALEKRKRVSVEGTPGIGKTLFGYILLRYLIARSHSVLFWDKWAATLITPSARVAQKYGLSRQHQVNGATLFFGMWKRDEFYLQTLLVDDDISVIHDPREGFTWAGEMTFAVSMAIIVSFGHELVTQWARKGGAPEASLFVPIFSLCETEVNAGSLFVGKAHLETGECVEQKHRKFGGSIRHWGSTRENLAWDELRSNIQGVVKNNGSGLAARGKEYKGSIVHVNSTFDADAPPYPFIGHNSLKELGYFLASEDVTQEFALKLQALGKASFQAFMSGVQGEKGSEAVYGVMFEVHAHEVLRNPPLEGFNIRVVRRDGKEKVGKWATVAIPVNDSGVFRFEGREPKGIMDSIEGTESITTGTYVWPRAGNFPTYDAAVIVNGSDVGLGHAKAALLLQMTVSGASGLPRNPRHAVKQHIRKQMHKTLTDCVSDFSANDVSVTTFCVPSACFYPFAFQMESNKGSDKTISSVQPEYQFVIEIKGFESLPRSTLPPEEIHGSVTRCHTFILRERPTKKQKTSDPWEIHGSEEES